MSTISTILDRLQKTIREKREFENVHIFLHRERKDDQVVEDVKVPSIYIYPGKPKRQDSDFRARFRMYPVNVLVKIAGRGKGYLPTESDKEAMELIAYEYAEAVLDLTYDYEIESEGSVYSVNVAEDVDMDFKPDKELLERDAANGQEVRRLMAVFDFYAVKNYEE